MAAPFQTNQEALHDLLKDCYAGKIQLPDFQRSWVWDEDRIKGLIASVSRGFPVGALMTLETGGEVDFKPRTVEGAPEKAASVKPQLLLLDGQQRMTSLFQVSLRAKVVQTITAKGREVSRWFYLDIRKAIDPQVEREEAVRGLPEERIERSDFNRRVDLDVSSTTKEIQELMFPLTKIFDWYDWGYAFAQYWQGKPELEVWETFRIHVIKNFEQYRVPVITLSRDTSKEAVCTVFEKVNTGGKALDAFELVTATYAAQGHELRKDWLGAANAEGKYSSGREARLRAEACFPGQKHGVIGEVASTDFLQAISLFHTRTLRQVAEKAGKEGKELPAVSCNRSSLLNLPLDAYLTYQAQAEEGFKRAAKFLNSLYIFRTYDLPYQTQVVPLAAILAELGPSWEFETHRAKLEKWYWCGVFGELYSSAIETRYAQDFMQVPAWVRGTSGEPKTVSDATFREDRLLTMRMRLSAAYKGVNALLMKIGAEDFRTGQKFDQMVFFNDNVDIHHIFPKKWCSAKGIEAKVYDSIINKTPLRSATNQAIGGDAPSIYLQRLQAGSPSAPGVEEDRLGAHLKTHLVDASLMRADAFDEFMAARKAALRATIERAMGKAAYTEQDQESGEYIMVSNA